MYSLLLLAFISFLISFALTPPVRNAFRRWSICDQPDAVRKLHTEPIPRVGGLILVISYLGALAVLGISDSKGGAQVRENFIQALPLIPAVVAIFAIGFADDLRNLAPVAKLGGQIAAAALAYWGGVHLTHVLGHELPGFLSFPLTVVWLVACANAFNLIDGVDGLAAGVGLFATVTILVAALLSNSYVLAMLTVPLAGAILGFLRYNFNPASIFLGDSGSLLVGFLLGCFGILWSQKSATILGMTAPLMAMAIPLLDTCLAIARRFLRRQPIFGGDRNHIHHQLLKRGLSPRRVALILYGVAGVFAALSLLATVVDERYTGAVVVLFAAVTWIGIQHLGYVEFGAASRMMLAGAFRRLLNAQLALNEFESSLNKASTFNEIWELLSREAQSLGFVSIEMVIGGRRRVIRDDSAAAVDCWKLHVALNKHDYVTLLRPYSCVQGAPLIAPFAGIVRSVLGDKLRTLPKPEKAVAASVGI